MIKKPIWIWKGVPDNFKEFRKEVLGLWLATALGFGFLIAIIIKELIHIFT